VSGLAEVEPRPRRRVDTEIGIGPRQADRRAYPAVQVFERFTDRARRVVVLAQEEARMLNHNYIGTEHILLGLVRERDGIAAMALGSLNIRLDAVRREVEEIIGRGQAAPTVTSRSRPAPRRSWSSRSARPCSWVTTTSGPSTSCSA
jgi:hypothetical protein